MTDIKDIKISYIVTDLLSSMIKTKPTKRDYIWATDLGKPFIDRYLEMNGVEYSNPNTAESIQNFILGSAVEDAYLRLFDFAGLLGNKQHRIEIKKKGLLKVTGKIDQLLEVKDWKKVIAKVKTLASKQTDKREKERYLALIPLLKKWQKELPNGIEKMPIEFKTVSIYAKNYHKNLLEGYPHYRMQLYAYLIGLGVQSGRMIFVAKGLGKNAGWVDEYIVERTPELDEEFWSDVETMSAFYNTQLQPQREEIYTGEIDKYGNKQINWRVRYSRYKDLVYPELKVKA